MSSLKKYMERVKQETENFTEIEKLRYVYLDLGKRFQFDLNFIFGNSKNKRDIYEHSQSEEELNKSMDNDTGICKSIAYIFEYVMKEVGINITTVVDPRDNRKCPHMYNIVTTTDGNKYKFDLQGDMRFIKAHLRTKYFGISTDEYQKPIVSRFELEQIDKKLGYITKDLYYTDEYLELIKMDMSLFEDFGERVQFVLENSEAYTDKNMGYVDRRWRMEELIGSFNKPGQLFSWEEKKKIHMVDCYKEKDGKKEYELCIVVDVDDGTDIYIFSEKENCFVKKTMDEFAELIENGLVNIQGINGLRQVLKERKKERESEEEIL